MNITLILILGVDQFIFFHTAFFLESLVHVHFWLNLLTMTRGSIRLIMRSFETLGQFTRYDGVGTPASGVFHHALVQNKPNYNLDESLSSNDHPN